MPRMTPRGEYVLVMAGAPAAEAEEELTLSRSPSGRWN